MYYHERTKRFIYSSDTHFIRRRLPSVRSRSIWSRFLPLCGWMYRRERVCAVLVMPYME